MSLSLIMTAGAQNRAGIRAVPTHRHRSDLLSMWVSYRFYRIEAVVSVCRIIGGKSARQRGIVFEKISVDRIKVINGETLIRYRLAVLVLDAEFGIFSEYAYSAKSL